jgi:hypothetical protein
MTLAKSLPFCSIAAFYLRERSVSRGAVAELMVSPPAHETRGATRT